MSEAFRLPGADGCPIRFVFDGMPYQGREGDTLASALLANGVHLVGRSYKYHRPRGILTAGAEEPNALVAMMRGPGRMTPNLRATQIEIFDGLEVRSQNAWPSLALDAGAINDIAGKFFSAGFYYKTFMGPKVAGSGLWTRVFEPIVRQAAGLGARTSEPDPDRYAQFHEHCDVLICGGGPAGIAAALAAGASGKDVVLCDEQAAFGGGLLHETRATIDGKPTRQWLAEALAALRAMPNVRLMPRTQAFGYYAQNFIALSERVADHLATDHPVRERLWQVRAKEVVIATGAIERPLVFSGNDRPGVMLAEAARIYLNRYGVKVGTRVVLVTAHDSAYRAALDLKAAGVTIAAIADLRSDPAGELVEAARAAGLPLIADARVAGTKGRLRVSKVGIAAGVGATRWIGCDCLLMSGGWTPSVHLYSQSRGKVVWHEDRQMFLPGASVQAERSAGACKGTFALATVLAEGQQAGAAAAGTSSPSITYVVAGDPPQSGGHLGRVKAADGASGKAFVDFQNDVKADDIDLAVQEGMRSIEHVKRYTTTGMATDQGKTSNLNALAIAAEKLGKSVPEVGLTTFRQPYTPVSFGAFAGANRGELFDPLRRTPTHAWAEESGAVFEDFGLWKRARYFPRAGEDMHAAVHRECTQARKSAGVFDASTLGKIEVVGPDSAAFLEMLYTNPWAKLEPGRCRYGLMLNEAGFVMDDGVIARLAADRFHVTTTTGGAPRVLHHMEDYLQTEFPDLRVWLTSTTEQWAVIAVQGPKAREIVAPLVEGFDIAHEAMPHMSIREGRVCGIPARVMRVSFTGELGYEINVPADFGRSVWEAVWAEGRKHDAVAYGTEAMHVMRAEKGHIIVGQETDGTVTPDDLCLGWAIGKAKKDFIGKRSLVRPDMVAPGRKQLVGLLTVNPETVLEEGAQITATATPKVGEAAQGHVTSAYDSPALGRSIALALVADGRKRKGQTLHVPMPGGAIAVTVVDPVFFDPKGDRLNV
ncbi:MAG TPA: sarcosine oxidase subunit alpha family protein [Beijerinckiaceae bacterium]|nr:sarcosine oxidase subunit alpha family protein [Beijerinckiaceae bacterium]